ncbi:hypothetical protein [Devosia sp. A449]
MADDLILTARIFAAKHSDMGHKKDRWWRSVPWGWVSVTAYITGLACVALSEVTSPTTAISFVKDYQTLLAGVATIAALLIAVQQLKRQGDRDVVDAVRHYEAEIDAMQALDKEARRLSNRTTGLGSIYAPDEIVLERERWDRLQHGAHVSLSGAIAQLLATVDAHNNLIPEPFGMGWMGGHDNRQLMVARQEVQYACIALMADIEQRRKLVLQLITATS